MNFSYLDQDLLSIFFIQGNLHFLHNIFIDLHVHIHICNVVDRKMAQILKIHVNMWP